MEFGGASGVLLRLPMIWLAMAVIGLGMVEMGNSKYSGGGLEKDYCKTPAAPAEFA